MTTAAVFTLLTLFRPHWWAFGSSNVPACPQEFAIQGKKKGAYAWGGGDWLQLELSDALILLPFSHDT